MSKDFRDDWSSFVVFCSKSNPTKNTKISCRGKTANVWSPFFLGKLLLLVHIISSACSIIACLCRVEVSVLQRDTNWHRQECLCMSLEFDSLIRNMRLLFSLDRALITGLYIFCALELLNGSENNSISANNVTGVGVFPWQSNTSRLLAAPNRDDKVEQTNVYLMPNNIPSGSWNWVARQ